MGMIAARAGYEQCGEWLQNILEGVRDNYDYLKTELGRNLPGITVCALEGTYLAFLDMRSYIDPEEIQNVIQGRCRLAVDYGEWFGDGYKGFIRINLATDPAYVREAVGNLVKELKKGEA